MKASDPLIKRLRWIMLLVMTIDLAVTLIGQPNGYWNEPTRALEGNPLVRFVMHQGIVPLLLVSLVYASLIFILASILPTRFGLFVLLTFTLAHFYGGCSWLVRFRLAHAPLIYAAILVGTLVAHGLFAPSSKENQDSEKGNQAQ